MKKVNIPLQLRCDNCNLYFDITDKLNTLSPCPECDSRNTLEISYSLECEEMK